MERKSSDTPKKFSIPESSGIKKTGRLSKKPRSTNQDNGRQDPSGVGFWDFNPATHEMEWSEELFILFGLNPATTTVSLEVWKTIMDPEDRVSAWGSFENSVRQKKAVDIEYRAHVSGDLRWFRSIGNFIFDHKGKCLTMRGICFEITSQKKKEEEMLELATQRKFALHAAKLGWWQYNPVTGISVWDDGFREIFGVSDYSRIDKEILKDIIHPDDVSELWNKVESSLNPDDPKDYVAEYRIIRPDGRLRWVEAHGIASFKGEGINRQAVNFVGTVQDITDRKNSEKEQQNFASTVQEERDWFAALINSVTDEIWFADKDKKVTLVNPAVRKEFGSVIGYNQEIQEVASSLEVYRNDGTPRPDDESPLLRALNGETVTYEEEIIRSLITGELRHRQISASPVFDSHGSIIGSVSVARDITHRRRNEEIIAYNEERNRILSEVASELLVSQDIQRGIDKICHIVMKFLNCQVFFNFLVIPGSKKLHLNAYEGISKAEGKRIEFLDFGVAVCGCVARDGSKIIAENIQKSEDKLTEIVRGYGVRAYCSHPLIVSNTILGTLSFGTTERDQWTVPEILMMETITGLMAVAIQRKRLEEELIESRKNLERAQMIGSIGNWHLNLEKDELVWSAENYRIFGITEGIPQTYETFLDVVYPEDREYVNSKWSEALAGKDYDIEHRIVADGKIKWVREKAFLEFDENGKMLAGFGITQDITKRKNAEDDLVKAKMKLDLALENANIGLWEYNFKTNKVYLDERSEKMFGLASGTFDGTFNRFEKLVHEEDIDHLRKAINNAHKNESYETIFRTRPINGRLRYISSKALVAQNEKDDAEILSGVNFDITELKEGTERLISRLNMDLLRSNSDLQQFAYVASHDLQEPLRMVSSFVQLLQLQYADKLDQNAIEYINFAVDGSKRMYELINGLLAYSRVQTSADNLVSVSMESVFTKVKENLVLLINETNASVTCDNLHNITAIENQMIQVLQNLIENGIKFNKGKPRIHISSKINNGSYIFSVKDNGIGIEKQYFERIFRIFQKLHTKQDYKGTGIGLAICKKIVERHGGLIWVESEPEKGTEFFFTIPKRVEGFEIR